MKRIIFLIALLISVFSFSLAQAQQVSLQKVVLAAVYVPIGFDSINKSQVTVEGIFQNTCYRVASHTVKITDNTITITQGANRYNGICADVLVPFSQVIDLGILKAGDYDIVDGTSGRNLGTLPVVNAPQKSPATYPDDYLYAPVTDASVLVDGGRRVVLSGAFTDDCTKLTEIRVQLFKNVIQVLPITERAASGCHHGFHPFQVSQPLAVADGHYLLHVRSLSGNAVSKMVDIYAF